MEKRGGHQFFLVCSCLLCHLLLLLLKQVMSNTLHLFFSFLTVPSSSKGKITEDNRALRNTGLLYISFLDLYMEEIIV